MMKRLRKPAALLLALVMALTLAACGGKGASKTNPAVGKYIGETVLSFDEWVPMDEVYDLGDNYIELKEDGTGCFMLDGDPTTIDWKLDKDGALTLDRDGAICNCTLKDGLITVNDYFGFDLQLTFRKSGGSTGGNTGADEMSLDDFADEYGGDWHGMAGDCQVWLAMYLEGENDFNFIDTYARVVPDDDTGLELRGTFMGGEMQDGILSVDETGALYVSCEVDSDLVDGSISLLANLRHLDDENWTDEDYIPMPESAVEYYRGMTFMEIASTFEIDTSLIPDNGSGDAAAAIPDGGDNGGLPENYPFERTTSNGEGEYGKSNPDATGRADLATMQKVRQELWDMSSSKSSKLTYDDIKAMLGGEDGIPHTGMDEKSWNSEKHAYGWFNGEGDYYVLYFVVRDGDEYYTAATFSSSVRGDS